MYKLYYYKVFIKGNILSLLYKIIYYYKNSIIEYLYYKVS